MPRRDVKMYLYDIVQACAVIVKCTEGRAMAYYLADEVAKSAVERKFEVIGEAMKNVLEAEPDLESRIPDARKAIQYRNFLIHAYDLVEHEKVWEIATTDIPKLAAAVSALLQERGGR